MAFNLNKNDGTGLGPSTPNKTTSKFDLSKKEDLEPIVTEPAPQSKTWIVGLLGILIIGGGIWYFTSRPASEGSTAATSTETALADTSAKVVPVASTTEEAAASTDTALATSSANQNVATTQANKDNTTKPASAKTAQSDAVVAKLNNTAPASFGEGSAKFKRIDKSLVRRIISYLTKNPEASIYVNGYASSDGPLAINQSVSQARADAFKTYLVSKNITESRVVAAGKGIENPIASNDTDAGRKKNRRVEVSFQ